MAWMPIIVILALIIGLAVWAGVFGGRADKPVTRVQQPLPPVVNAQDGASTATITEVREPATATEATSSSPSAAVPAGVATTQTSTPPIATTQPAVPPVTSSPPRAVVSTTQPPPRTVAAERPESRPAPRPAPPRQTAAAPRPAPAPSREISEDDAMNVLRGYIIARNYYPVDRNCFHVVSLGYKNVGYTLDVVDRCGNRGRLGRWRVDSKTREVFRQQGDGRFLRP